MLSTLSFQIEPLAYLAKCYFHLVLFSTVLILASCGVCDTSSSSPSVSDQFEVADACDAQLSSRDSSGFDINPALSPVFGKGAMESSSGGFDWNVFGDKEQLSWWNVKILGVGGAGAGNSHTI
ncbi:unnamed protein product [Caenorhabditis sp. 36 PRJEB53466]|nr:unnamed protein product [Caenorhabditis sp. 36 PRJEB53466]